MPTVEMNDGRTVEFAETRGFVKFETLPKEETDGKLVVRFDFKTGDTFNLPVPENLLEEAAAYGVARRIVTAAKGNSSESIESARALATQIEAGDFSITRTSTGLSTRNVMVQAFAEFANIDISDAVAKLAPLSKAEMKQLEAAPALAAIVARIKAENDSKKQEKEEAANSLVASLLDD